MVYKHSSATGTLNTAAEKGFILTEMPIKPWPSGRSRGQQESFRFQKDYRIAYGESFSNDKRKNCYLFHAHRRK